MNVRYPSFKIHEDICAENMEELIQMISNFLDGKDCSKIKDAHYKIKDIYTVKPPGQTWFRISEDIQKELNSKHS